MKRFSRGFSWPIKPKGIQLTLNVSHPLCPDVCFPFNEGSMHDHISLNIPGAFKGLTKHYQNLAVDSVLASAISPGVGVTPLGDGIKGRVGGVGNYYQVLDNAALKPAGSFSLEAWVIPWGTSTANTGIVSKWDATNGYMLFFGVNLVYAYVKSVNPSAAVTLVVGQLYQFVNVWDGATVKIYVNGQERNSSAQASGTQSTTAFQFGAYNAGAGTGDWINTLTNLYHRALTPGEVRERYVRPLDFFAKPKLAVRYGKTAVPPPTPVFRSIMLNQGHRPWPFKPGVAR